MAEAKTVAEEANRSKTRSCGGKSRSSCNRSTRPACSPPR